MPTPDASILAVIAINRATETSRFSVRYAVAFGGGVVSFLSPCVLPLVPVYLSLVTGLDVAEVTGTVRGQLLRVGRDTTGFVAGFTAVFIALGLTATATGRLLVRNQAPITRVAGLIMLALALFLAGSLVLKLPWLYRERRPHPDLSRYGPLAAPVAGVAFRFGWTPCIGPVLGSVLAVAATRGQELQGATLLAAYSAGLGVPFLAAGLAYARLASVFGWVQRHSAGLVLASALVLAGFGVLLTLDRLTWVTSQLQTLLRHTGLQRLTFLG
jgi:cytochrome c-type biogenesis protein